MTELRLQPRDRRPVFAAGTPHEANTAPDIQRGWAARWWPFAAVLLPAIAISLVYVHRTYVNVVILDGFIHVPHIGDALAHGGSIRDLVRAPFSGEHLLLGYRLYLFANAKLFGLDMRLDPVMFVLASAATTGILYADFLKIFRSRRPALLFLAFIPLGFLSFSFVAPPLFLMTTQFVWGTVVGLLIAYQIQRDLDPEQQWRPILRRPLARALALIPVYFLVSGAYFPGLSLGLLAMFLFRRLLEHTKWIERRFILVAGVLVPSIAVYTYLMSHSSRPSSTSSGVRMFFSDLGGSLLSYIAGIGAAMVDSHTVENMRSSVLVAIGLAGAVIIILSLWLFVTTRMYRQTYLPVYCIFYSLGIVTSVRIGRTDGWRWISAEWYAFHLRFFVIGVAWILVYTSLGYSRRRRATRETLIRRTFLPIGFVVLAAIFIGACQYKGNTAQWNRSPAVKQYYEQKRVALIYPQLVANPDEILLWPAEQVAQARAVLKKYSLSSFSDQSRGEIARRLEHDILRGSDWYGDDWIGRDGRALLVASRPSPVRLAAQLPTFIPRNRCELRLNDAVIFTGELSGDTTTTLAGRLRRDVNTVTVSCADAVSPASQGEGEDSRPLAVRVRIERG